MPQLRGELAARAVPSPSSFRNAFSSRASGSPAWMASCCTAPAATPMCLETPRLHQGPRPGGVTAETNLRVALVMGQPRSRAALRTHLLMHPAHSCASQRVLPSPTSRCPPALPPLPGKGAEGHTGLRERPPRKTTHRDKALLVSTRSGVLLAVSATMVSNAKLFLAVKRLLSGSMQAGLAHTGFQHK